MDINLNPQVDKIAKVVTGQVKTREIAPPKEEVELSESRALEDRLAAVSDVRTEVVDRARGLVANPHYPPAETIAKIASLLAISFETQ